ESDRALKNFKAHQHCSNLVLRADSKRRILSAGIYRAKILCVKCTGSRRQRMQKPKPSRGFTSNKSEEAPQDYCDKRAPGYDNKAPVNSWLVGGGKRGAEGMPHYDKSPKFYPLKKG